MDMSKFVITNHANSKEILRVADHYVALPVTVSDDGVAVIGGKKIVKAGTIVGGKTKSVVSNIQEPVVTKNTSVLGKDAEGILLYDVDVTHGPNAGSMVIHGYINADKLPEAVEESAKIALKQITFIGVK